MGVERTGVRSTPANVGAIGEDGPVSNAGEPEGAVFGPATQAWLDAAFASPTQAQLDTWTQVATGRHVLTVAPTGSGKTLAAFLSAIDRLLHEPLPPRRDRVLYLSPLKALGVDVERNLQGPFDRDQTHRRAARGVVPN